MEYIVIFILCIFVILLIKYALGIKIKNFKKVKQIGYNQELNKLTNKLPENKIVCKDLLTKLNKTDVEIQQSEDSKSQASFYMVLTNRIIIANIKDTFTRIQTIAHECIHSTQNRKLLMFNFIYSNIYILYFIGISILTICRVVKQPIWQVVILLLLSFIYYSVRSYLETDAMTRAPYLAKEYLQESGQNTPEEIETIMSNYEKINSMGIPMVNFQFVLTTISKVMIYCVIAYIMMKI